jgi:hypothetical protein
MVAMVSLRQLVAAQAGGAGVGAVHRRGSPPASAMVHS